MTRYTLNEGLNDILTRLKNARSRDEHDDLMGELAEIAPKHISELDELYDANTYYRMPLIWCLIGETSKQAEALFTKAIKDRDQYTRWAAATALARCKTRHASSLLVAALKDRSHLVKHIAVDAMELARFRDPAAVPQLTKIVNSKHLQRNAPGIVTAAKKALRACKRAS